jgi:hypothetical protein
MRFTCGAGVRLQSLIAFGCCDRYLELLILTNNKLDFYNIARAWCGNLALSQVV